MDVLSSFGTAIRFAIPYALGFLTAIFVKAFDLFFDELKEDRKRQRAAAESLFVATGALRQAVWSFCALHVRYGVAQKVPDFEREKAANFEAIRTAWNALDRDFDLPECLAEECRKRHNKMQIAFANLCAFAVTAQRDDMERCAQELEDDCNAIHELARQYPRGAIRSIAKKLHLRS